MKPCVEKKISRNKAVAVKTALPSFVPLFSLHNEGTETECKGKWDKLDA